MQPRQNSQANMNLFIGDYTHDVHRAAQLSTGGRPWKTPLFDYSSTMAKEKPQEQGLAEMISAHGARDKELSGGPSNERENEREQERKGERGAKNEVKFIRVQTDVNLFKLRDFGNGWER